MTCQKCGKQMDKGMEMIGSGTNGTTVRKVEWSCYDCGTTRRWKEEY